MSALTRVTHIDTDLPTYLAQVGQVFRVFDCYDSGCTAYGVLSEGRRWFVKGSDEPDGIASLHRAIDVNRLVQHPALPRLHHSFTTPRGLARRHVEPRPEGQNEGDQGQNQKEPPRVPSPSHQPPHGQK